MEQNLQQTVLLRMKDILAQDSALPCPVVQSVSLFFWNNLSRWVRQIAFVPEPFVIALTGPSGSGKSFIRQELVSQLSQISAVSAFTQDNYYRDFEADYPHLPLGHFYDEIDFDDPVHIRFRRLCRDLQRIHHAPLGSTVKIPYLRFGTPAYKPTIIEDGLNLSIDPFMITEGIHAFYDPTILPHYNFKIYVDVDEITRRERWLHRNLQENRGTTDNMWNTTVTCLQRNILPTRPLADLVINNNAPREAVAAFIEAIINVMADPFETGQREIA